MPDQWAHLRSLPFDAVANQLGVDLKRFKHHGKEWSGYCPIHGSKNNNNVFHYNENGKWNCFGCPAKGSGIIDLTKQVLSLGFQEATNWLQERFGTYQPAKPLPDTKKPASVMPDDSSGALKPLANDSWRKFQVPCPWLEQRIPDAAIREKYGVYCYDNPARRSTYSGRVMIPIKDVEGVLYGYLGRTIQTDSENSAQAKYLFPKNLPKSRFLFGAYELRQHLAGISPLPSSRYAHVYLVESPFCVMKFASLGLPAVSPFGWSVSVEQIEILQSLTKSILYVPDRNKYQQCESALSLLAKSLWVRFPQLPEGVDDPEQLQTAEQIQALTR